ncbi:MAG: UTP--glucose-1-phosphate uridylyltransferase [Proteobacteria bacterium]|nr:UTP--glucose-1-phosphate uridylyltransferase [Pseudomonadota bacterium]
MTDKAFLDILRRYEQHHILGHYHSLPADKQNQFLKHHEKLDINLIFSLHKTFSYKQNPAHRIENIKPADIITIPQTFEEKALYEKARASGESLIRGHKVANLIVAGGQGSRLGFEGPKGTFPATPIKKKTLFQLFAESVKAINKKYNTSMPLLIMTSHENHEETIDYFESNNYFGLKKDTVRFFMQGMIPSITPEGDLILRDETYLFTNPDGHGGSLKALHDSGLLYELIEKGFTELFYCQVDNPLVKIADPVFMGYHAMSKAQASTKVVRRTNIDEKVGIYLSVNNKDAIAEYSDLPAEFMAALDEHGNIRYWAGNTAIHAFSLAFIKQINRHGYSVPYHRAHKTVEVKDKNGSTKLTDAWKFETFVFDAIPLADKTCCMEVIREEEFSPIKNKDGVDSPDTARTAMSNLHRSRLEAAGVKMPPETRVEISPLFALDKEELAEKMKGKELQINGDIYLG